MAVYLIHFSCPYKHAQHYVGYAVDVEKRFAQHKSGRGARLLKVLIANGINFEIARVWPEGDRALERQIKRKRNARALCPICGGCRDGSNNETRA